MILIRYNLNITGDHLLDSEM